MVVARRGEGHCACFFFFVFFETHGSTAAIRLCDGNCSKIHAMQKPVLAHCPVRGHAGEKLVRHGTSVQELHPSGELFLTRMLIGRIVHVRLSPLPGRCWRPRARQRRWRWQENIVKFTLTMNPPASGQGRHQAFCGLNFGKAWS